MTHHLPPPPVWRAAQARAKACGLWLDMTLDGMFHVRRVGDNRELSTHPTLAAALACVGAGRKDKAA